MHAITLVVAGPLMLLFSLLGSAVSLRRVGGTAAPDAPGIPFNRLQRAHGNLAEHGPFLVLLLYLCETTGAARNLLWAAAFTILAARLLHATGMVFARRTGNPAQFVGATLTYVAETGLGVLALSRWFA